MQKKEEGLKDQYLVERRDGKPVGPCVVLEFRDPNTHRALAKFADTVRREGYEVLAADIYSKLEQHGCNVQWLLEEKSVIRYGLERLVRDINIDLDVRNKAEVTKDFQCNPKR